MTQDLEHILSQLSLPDTAAIQQVSPLKFTFFFAPNLARTRTQQNPNKQKSSSKVIMSSRF